MIEHEKKEAAIAAREYFEHAVEINGQTYRHGIAVRPGETVADDVIAMMFREWENSLRDRLVAEAKG